MAKYRVTTDGGTYEVTTDEPDGIPGMEKLGGKAPPPPKPPNPVGEQSGTNWAGSLRNVGHAISTMGLGEQPPAENGQLPEIVNPLRGIGEAAARVGHTIMNPRESFTEDPLGTISTFTTGAQGGINAIRGIARRAPGIAEGAKAAAPSLLKKIPYVGPVAEEFSKGYKRGMAPAAPAPPPVEPPGVPPAGLTIGPQGRTASPISSFKQPPISGRFPDSAPPPAPQPVSTMPPPAPAPAAPPARPSLDSSLANLRSKVEAKYPDSFRSGKNLGEASHGSYPERYDEGSAAPKMPAPGTRVLKTVPKNSVLANNPKALQAAKEMADQVQDWSQ